MTNVLSPWRLLAPLEKCVALHVVSAHAQPVATTGSLSLTPTQWRATSRFGYAPPPTTHHPPPLPRAATGPWPNWRRRGMDTPEQLLDPRALGIA